MTAKGPAPGAVGVLGGTFDPVHLGHLRIAEETRRILELARVLLLPTAVPPHKPTGRLTPIRHRVAMVRLAIEGREGLELCPLELSPHRTSFTIDTLHALRDARPPVRPVFILGLDMLAQISSWYRWRELLAEFDLAVVDRIEDGAGPPAPLAAEVTCRLVDVREGDPASRLEPGRGGRVFRLPVTPVAVSASAVRARVAAGADPVGLVPAAVARYIGSAGLYRLEERP